MIKSFQIVEKLPYSTAECDYGPELKLTNGKLTIKYDIEHENGILWASIIFLKAISLKITPEVSITDPMLVNAYNAVGEFTDSKWKKELCAGDPSNSVIVPLRHFLIYFDHHYALEVMAESYIVGETEVLLRNL